MHTSGLVISEGLLEAYGGELTLEQDDADEPLLHFVIPANKPADLLIVDDDSDTVRLYQVYCEGLDCTIRVASGVEEVDAQLGHGLPDAILLDVLMPQTDGWRILQRLKADPATAGVPIVVCSVLSQPRLALALGAEAVLQKPIERVILLRTLQEVLTRADTAA
jgi:CheY-like chemotaxis protein